MGIETTTRVGMSPTTAKAGDLVRVTLANDSSRLGHIKSTCRRGGAFVTVQLDGGKTAIWHIESATQITVLETY